MMPQLTTRCRTPGPAHAARLLLAICLLAHVTPARQTPPAPANGGTSYVAKIKSISYRTTLGRPLRLYEFTDFDINRAEIAGRLRIEGREIAYSKWKTPKRTRSFPYERIYDTYAKAPLVVTVIPVLKDEGRDGDLDRVQFSTLSLMSLLGVHIVLAYYDSAHRSARGGGGARERLTDQRFDNAFVKDQIAELARSNLPARVWNERLFERRLVEIMERALKSYETISATEGVALHDYAGLRVFLARVKGEYREFRRLSLQASADAAQRELTTTHKLEVLGDGEKSALVIEDSLGGLYYWTADEVFYEGGRLVLQEAKNTIRHPFPATPDIKDALLKLILYSNFAELRAGGESVPFVARLKLTGRLTGSLRLPARREQIVAFLCANASVFGEAERSLVEALQREVAANRNLEIVIKGNG